MERYPDSVRDSVYELIRSGTTPEDVIEQYGIARGTAYRFMQELRVKGEDVAFMKLSDRVKEKAFARFAEGASVQAVFEEFVVSRAVLYRWRNEFEEQNPSVSHTGTGGAAQASGDEMPAAGKDEPSGIKRRKLAEPPKDVLIRQLKTALAEKTLEADFFRGALREVEVRRQQNTKPGEKRSTRG
jgi:transposase-like protein